MFPSEAHFICRRCTCRFYFTPDVFPAALAQKSIACPSCGTAPDRPGPIERFFRFYPRLVTSTAALKDCGFEFADYRFTVDEFSRFFVDHLSFRCTACGGISEFPMSRVVKFAGEPGLFACKRCKVQAAPLKIAKEFFVSVRAVDRESAVIHDFLWDIVSPLRLDPADYPVQWRIYRDAGG